MVLPRLDVVLGLAAGAVERLVELLGTAALQVGHDEARVDALGPGLDPRDDALDPAPALGTVVEFLEAPHLAARGRRPEALCRGFLQRLDMAAQRRVGGEAEHPIDPVGTTPFEHFRSGIVAVGAQQDLDLRPVRPNGTDETAQEGADLTPARPLARAQQRGDETALAVKDDDRLEAVIVVVALNSRNCCAP
jgi:hypothetical protein